MHADDHLRFCKAPWQVVPADLYPSYARLWAIPLEPYGERPMALYLAQLLAGDFIWFMVRDLWDIAYSLRCYWSAEEAEESLYSCLAYAYESACGPAPLLVRAPAPDVPVRAPGSAREAPGVDILAYWVVRYQKNTVRGPSWHASRRGGPAAGRGTTYVLYSTADLLMVIRTYGPDYPVHFDPQVGPSVYGALHERLHASGIACFCWLQGSPLI